MMDWTHHHATINGIRMHYVEQGEGLPVVLCHGFPHLRQVHMIPGAGYMVQLEASVEVNEILPGYLGDISRRDRSLGSDRALD